MKCLDNLKQYNMDHIKANKGFQKPQTVVEVSKKPHTVTGVTKNLKQ